MLKRSIYFIVFFCYLFSDTKPLALRPFLEHPGVFDYQRGIDEGKKILVGVNKYESENNETIDIQNIDEAAIKQQLDRLNKIKEHRDNDVLQKSLEMLKEYATEDKNLIPPIIHAVKAYATLGEISDTLRSVFGEY